MPRVVTISDKGWLTITMRATTDMSTVADPAAWARDARLLFEQLAALPADPDLQADLIQAEEQLAAARSTIERQANQLLNRPATAVAARPATVPLPEAFEGDTKTYLDFKTKLNNKFRTDAPTFCDDQHCLSVATSLLRKGAADIIRPYIRDDHIDLANIQEFWTFQDRAFDDPDRTRTAQRNLSAL